MRTTTDFETIDQSKFNILKVIGREGKNPDDYLFVKIRKHPGTRQWRFNAFYIGDLKGD